MNSPRTLPTPPSETGPGQPESASAKSPRGQRGQIGLRAQVALVAVLLTAVLTGLFVLERRTLFLPGTTSDGHYLMELSCNSCHGGFAAIGNEACHDCHRAELANDTHPVKVFDDPRWAADLEEIDAQHCITCHGEHQRVARSVTVGAEFCYPCHDDVVEKRASHRTFAPDSCGAAGCHNYHDNSALNTAYLKNRDGQPALLPGYRLPQWRRPEVRAARAAAPAVELPAGVEAPPELTAAWRASGHAAAAVGCMDCHGTDDGRFVEQPGFAACAGCHRFEAETFGAGKHGIRTRLGLSPLTPEMARLPMKPAGPERPEALGCGTCHDVHRVDTRRAATEACLSCHDDTHSRTFADSPHATGGAERGLLAAGQSTTAGELALETADREVTCATCHLPRLEIEDEDGPRVAVHHNNTFTLQPPDRMADMVCQHCHGLELALTSLLDEELVENNFRGRPHEELETFRMIARLDEPPGE